MNMLPILSSIIIFAAFAIIYGEGELTTAKVYTVISTFNLIVIPMRQFVIASVSYVNGKASL